ncbi:FecR family protein [Belliella marina]|uniref:FecR family protein n=1 Tax=Belliella marina TaxID=1644146 RepID=A0ABW4VLT2_9BACT
MHSNHTNDGDEPSHGDDIKSLLASSNSKGVSSWDKKLLWERIEADIQRKKKRFFYRKIGIAATLISLLISGVAIVTTLTTTESGMAEIAQNISLESFESNDVQLFLSDTRNVEISSEESNITYQAGGKISIDSSEEFEEKNFASGFNTLIVPYGRKTKLTLEDGTKVWVNSGSKLVYPVSFNNKERKIFVEGEAFFEVTKDNERPFIVETNDTNLRVLGTSFNVSSYSDDQTISAVLVTGSLMVLVDKSSKIRKKETLLKPNDRLSFHKASKKTVVKKVNVSPYISWKDGYLIYNSTSLKKVFTQLERYYNIEIVLSDPLISQEKLSGKLDLKQNAEEILEIICSTSKLKLDKNERRYIINKSI